MSLHLCPNCKDKGIAWHMDDDDKTWWYCSFCEFSIEEDESKERFCEKCKSPFSTDTFMKNEKESYYWCGSCGTRTNI